MATAPARHRRATASERATRTQAAPRRRPGRDRAAAMAAAARAFSRSALTVPQARMPLLAGSVARTLQAPADQPAEVAASPSVQQYDAPDEISAGNVAYHV
jgi:hypothetical protein